MEIGVSPCNFIPNLDNEDSKACAAVNGILKMVQQKKKLHAKMRDLKHKMNTSDEMLKKQRQLLHQFQHIEKCNKRHWKKNHTSYGKSIDYLAESPILRSKMKQIKEHKKNKHNKKKNFLSKGCFRQAVDSLEESSSVQKLFEQGDEPISTVGPNPGYGARTIDFSGVVWDFHKESREKAVQEPVSTRIKHK